MNLENEQMKTLPLCGTIQIEIVKHTDSSVYVYLFDTSTKKIINNPFRIYNHFEERAVLKLPNTQSFYLDLHEFDHYSFFYYDIKTTTLNSRFSWELKTEHETAEILAYTQLIYIPFNEKLQFKFVRQSLSRMFLYLFDKEKDAILPIPESFEIYDECQKKSINKNTEPDMYELLCSNSYSFVYNEEIFLKLNRQHTLEIKHKL